MASSFETVSESEASAGHEVNVALVRSGTELGPQGIAEFNRQIDQRVAEVTGRDRETSHFADDEESYIDASCGEEREDVAEARRLPQRLGVELHFGEKDNLEMAEAKLRRRALLEADILKQIEPFDNALRRRELEDIYGIAQNGKEIVEEIREIGERSGTSVVKPTEIIASILEVFEKMCKHALVDMETKGGVDESLEKFQSLMEERLRKLKAYEMEKAEEILKQAFDLLEISRCCASKELKAVMDVIENVEQANCLLFFYTAKKQFEETILGETAELDHLKKSCEGDLVAAETFEMELHEKHRKCTKFHEKLMQNFERNLEKNRQEQELLRRKLQELETHEKELEEKKELERESQENAIECVEKGVTSVKQESTKIQEVKSRAEASLNIMEKTKGLGMLVFDCAFMREQDLQEALKRRKANALRENRSALMESAVAHRLLGKDHEKNMQDAMQEIRRLKEEQRQKAQRGHKLGVAKIKKDLDEQEALLVDEKGKMKEARREYEALVAQIEEVEKGMDNDDITLKTEVEDLYRERQKAVNEFWEPDNDERSLESIPEWSMQ